MKAYRYLQRLGAACAFAILLCSLAGPSALAAAEPSAETLFQQGNTLYGQGQYQEALQLYTRIIKEDGFSAPLLYNLANCYAQIGQIGPAVLNYERVLLLSPGNSDARGNLDLLRKNSGLFQEELPWFQRAASFFNLDQWTLLAGFCWSLFALVNLAGIRFANGKNVRRWIGGGCMFFLVLAGTGACFQYRQQDAAIVTGGDARLLLSPFPASASVGTLQEGRLIYPLTQHGPYSLVEEPSGRTGWLESKAITPIAGVQTGPAILP